MAAGMLAGGGVAAQTAWSQDRACPGWNNPTSFTNGDARNYYAGQEGRISSRSAANCPNVLTGWTGTTWNNTTYSGSEMDVLGEDCNHYSTYGEVPNYQRKFAIMTTTSQAAGHPVNRDPNTGDRLPFVPTQFNTNDNTGLVVNTNLTSSIRVGDICANGGTTGAQALYYHIRPTTDNAMLFIYYAIVVESPSHSVQDNPWFIIRVTKKGANGQFVNIDGQNNQLSDTLAYYVGSTPDTRGGTVHIESDLSVNGWHSYGSGGGQGHMTNNYKDWSKVAINLSNYLYQDLRVEVIIMDCTANYHYAYAYVAGECRKMIINQSGCPSGLDSSVTTLSAPGGMLRYEWQASEYGVSAPVTRLEAGGEDDYFTFRTLRMPDGTAAAGPEDSVMVSGGRRDTVHYNIYKVQASDFRIPYRKNAAKVQGIRPTDGDGNLKDSVDKSQTFRCRMTSALDPAKPFQTNLYLSVTNLKPSMIIDQEQDCAGNVRIWNRSEVPGDPSEVNLAASTWKVFNNPECTGTPTDNGTGSSLERRYDDTASRYVLLRTVCNNSACYSEAVYRVRPYQNPNPGMTFSKKVLCDADQTVATDTTTGVYYREWQLLNDQEVVQETIKGERGNATANRVWQRSFASPVNPVTLRVLNGDYAFMMVGKDTRGVGDTVWCERTVRDTVAVFLHPRLTVEGDSVVCQGSMTDVGVRVLDVEGCTYEWSLEYGSITGGISTGDRLVVEPYADTSRYYVKVTSPQGCVAWDSVRAFYVRPQLELLSADRICAGDTVTLAASNADHYLWTASPSDGSLAGQATADTIRVVPQRSTVYSMTGYGSNNCASLPLTQTIEVVPLPVPAAEFSPDTLDSEAPLLTMKDLSQWSVDAQWLFADGVVEKGKEVEHTLEGAYRDTLSKVVYTVYNALGCSVRDSLLVPVRIYTAWFPNVFTPGSEDGNAQFYFRTANKYDYFHISIYNRRGVLVFESTDPQFRWDGTHKGTPCVQGNYVYVCSYRKPSSGTIMTWQGSVLLLR